MALPDAFPMTAAVAPSTRRMALLLAGLAMFGPFSIDTIFPAFPQLAQRLAVDEVAVQQTISVYLLFYGLMSLAHGPLSDAWGRKRVILGGLVVFVGASVGCDPATKRLQSIKLNGSRSEGGPLSPGDEITLGLFRLKFEQE